MVKLKKDDPRAVLRRRVGKVPKEPGVYRWLDQHGKILYIGKAKNLKNRMQGYVQDGLKRSAWTEIMVRQIADFEVTLVRSEVEALILESNLIKKFQPKYNVLLKDDKGYVYVRISLKDPYPRVSAVRQLQKDGARYFGPFLGARDTEHALTLLDSILRYKACRKSLDVLNRPHTAIGEKTHPGTSFANDVSCLEHQIGKCNGLCIGAVSQADYKQRIDTIVSFFRGNFASVKRIAKESMAVAVSDRKFEAAARLRDALRFIGELEDRQAVSDPMGSNIDVFGIALKYGKIQVVLLRQRDGKLIEQVGFPLSGEADSAALALEQFLPQYYEQTDDLPEIVVLRDLPDDASSLQAWLKEKHGKAVSIVVPERGKKSKLLEMAERNAEEKVQQQFAVFESEARKVEESLTDLQTLLSLSGKPRRIECYDISHSSGSATVGSMVVFINGKPKREHYRSFNMKTVLEGRIDDYASLKETLRRRLRYLTDDLKTLEKQWKEKGVTFGKVRKEEREKVLALIHAETFSEIAVDFAECVVARKEDKIMALGYLHTHTSGHLELFCVWVEGELRGERLGSVISQMLLKRTEKKKVYLGAKPSLEEYYSEIGFRHVIDPSDELRTEINRNVPEFAGDIIMMYDGKQHKVDESFTDHPNLLLIDGGKGQLSAVKEVLDELKLTIPLASLAKREEEIFLPGNQVSLSVPQDSSARFLLQRLRDEAHRFANFKRETRLEHAMFQSKLDAIAGIGPKTRDELISRFGSADDAIGASDEELRTMLTEVQVKALRGRFPRNFP
ncbi:excinuclease ABC subunit UvrC [Candidatus Peribacteria bacterium]|nr:excinuclease ABC subunit UvrC [Candidatus Peribacteria bacterium]